MKHYGMFYLDGQWVEAPAAARFTLINPATETPYATLALGNADDVDRAVGAARRAFASFGETTKAERIALLERVVEEFEAREEDIMAAVSLEMGAPRSLKAHTRTGIEAFRQAISSMAWAKAYGSFLMDASTIGSVLLTPTSSAACLIRPRCLFPVHHPFRSTATA